MYPAVTMRSFRGLHCVRGFLDRGSIVRPIALGLLLGLGLVLGNTPEVWAAPVELTAEEQTYLAQHSPLTVVFDRDYPPFEYLENGEFQGFTRGLLDLLEARIGVRLRRVAPATWTQALEWMRRGEADIITSIVRTPEREGYLLFTKPYFSLPLAILTRKDAPWTGIDSLHGRTIILVRNYAESELIRQRYAGRAQFIEVDTISEALLRLAFGEADAAVHNSVVAAHLISHLGLTTLHTTPLIQQVEDLCLAVRRDAPLLASILDKALASITPEEWEALRQRWLPVIQPIHPDTRRFLTLAGVIGLGLLVATTITALVLSWRLRIRVRQLHTAHRETHRALQRLQVALEASKAGIWEHDCTSGEESHETSWYRMLGYPVPQDQRNGYAEWRSLVHPDDLPAAEAAFQDFLRDPDKERYTSRFRIQAADGTWRWILSFGQAMERDDAGRPLRVVGIHLDIHAIETTRQQLLHSERQLRAILHHVPLAFGLFRRTPEGQWVIEDYNPAASQTMEIDAADVLGRPLLEVFPRLKQTPFVEMLDATLEYGTPHIQDAQPYTTRLGQQRFYAIIAFPVPTGLVGVFFRDVTEQHRSQEATEDALKLFTTVFHLSPEALALVDKTGRILHANAEFTRLTDTSATLPEYIGSISLFSERLAELHNLVLLQGQTLRRELEVGRPDGTRIPLVVIARPLSLHGESHMLLALRDMTEHHRVQELLVQTEKMLSLGGIAAGIAHEINNPLGIILQSAQNAELRLRPDFLKNRQIAEELGVNLDDLSRYLEARGIPGFLADIREAGGRAATIVRTMLDFSRKSESKRALVAVHEMIENAISLASKDYDLKKHYDFRQITIERDFAAKLPPVFVSQTEIEQVLLNLLRNAAQALHEAPPADGPRIRITTRANAGTIHLTVTDNGPGIPPAIGARIFEPFFTTKPPGQGTGLGLAVSYFIVQNHGGRLWVESQPGQGASFHLELPITPASAT